MLGEGSNVEQLPCSVSNLAFSSSVAECEARLWVYIGLYRFI